MRFLYVLALLLSLISCAGDPENTETGSIRRGSRSWESPCGLDDNRSACALPADILNDDIPDSGLGVYVEVHQEF